MIKYELLASSVCEVGSAVLAPSLPAMVHVVERKRKRSKLVEERTPPTSDAEADASWTILESGVLAVQTTLNVIGIDGAHRPVFYDHHQKRLVCKHGWPANRVCALVGRHKAHRVARNRKWGRTRN